MPTPKEILDAALAKLEKPKEVSASEPAIELIGKKTEPKTEILPKKSDKIPQIAEVLRTSGLDSMQQTKTLEKIRTILE